MVAIDLLDKISCKNAEALDIYRRSSELFLERLGKVIANTWKASTGVLERSWRGCLLQRVAIMVPDK